MNENHLTNSLSVTMIKDKAGTIPTKMRLSIIWWRERELHTKVASIPIPQPPTIEEHLFFFTSFNINAHNRNHN